jgi:type 1 glutamine amidotransferase
MAHAPIHTFPVQVTDPDHPLNAGIPSQFAVEDELYLFELQGELSDYKILLTTEYDILGVDMVRSNYAYTRGYPWDPKRKIRELQELYEKNALPKQSEMLVDRDPGERNAPHPDLGSNNNRVLAYERKVGKGAVCYIGLGHCTVNIPGRSGYKGPWANPTFEKLVQNAIAWAAA